MSHLALPQFLAPTQHARRRAGTITALTRPRDDVDSFLSSDLELSLANTSLNSPPQEPIALTPDTEYDAAPMDISPSPPKTLFGGPPTNSRNQDDNPFKPAMRPRAFTSAARIFGGDMSNGSLNGNNSGSINGSMKSGASSAKRTQRAALPMEWLRPPAKENTEPSSPGYDAMDVDMSYEIIPPSASTQTTFTPAPLSAASTATFTNLFYDTMSPASVLSPGVPQHKKRRSCSPDGSKYDLNDSSPAQPSPSEGKLRRVPSGPLLSRIAKPALQGLGGPPANAQKRPRRPVLSAMVPPSDGHRALSAYPTLDNGKESFLQPAKNLPYPRRAFSALIAPSNLLDQSSEDSSFEGLDSSPAQAYAQRQQQRTIRRCDGTEDFKPMANKTNVPPTGMQESPSAKFLGAGMPGFGDNEAAGKILPCHRVADDGLMRIKPDTLDALLDGAYDGKINNYYVIDCRFDYEYNGGHIDGAININSTARLEQELLGLLRPKPTVSGDLVKQTILVFHCEFSAKRAPTFAKHLRQKDRAMNNHNYPRIHYPELYILEGGYFEYFKSSKSHRKPATYTPMDDPAHAASRREDLDQFRKAKFGRHKSYAYGDAMSKPPTQLKPAPQLKRNTAPSGQPSMFAAANAARTRRSGSGGSGSGKSLHTLAEDGNTTAAEETDVDIGDSPCPPPSKATALKIRKPRALSRAETYGPGRMPLQY